MTPNFRTSDAAARVQDRLASLSPLARYLLVFGAGLLIGLVVFGWILFPVQWTQTYPNDLQADIQNDYLALTSDSYNLTGDLDRAVQRLSYWKALDLVQIANRYADQLQAAGSVQEADRLRALVEDASIYRLSLAPQTEPAASGQAAAPVALDPATRRLLVYLLVGIAALAVLLVLMRLLRIPLIGQRRQTEEEEEVETEADEIEGQVLPPMPGRPSAPPAAAPSYAAFVGEVDEYEEAEEDESADELLAEDDRAEIGDWDEEEEDDLAPPPTPPQTATSAAPRRGPAYESLRFDGDASYNEIRDISDRGEYAGEFGMAGGKQDPDTPGAVYSMEVWLFDKSDIHTVTAVLMHPDSHADESRRQQLAGNYQALALQDGAPIQLHTKSLELEGRVRRVAFGPAGSKGPTIRFLELELAGRRL